MTTEQQYGILIEFAKSDRLSIYLLANNPVMYLCGNYKATLEYCNELNCGTTVYTPYIIPRKLCKRLRALDHTNFTKREIFGS